MPYITLTMSLNVGRAGVLRRDDFEDACDMRSVELPNRLTRLVDPSRRTPLL